MALPNWLRIILAVLSALSFVPQLQRIRAERSSRGFSAYYVLFNLIDATEHSTLVLFLLVNNNMGGDIFSHYPPTSGDWLNLAQMSVVWVLFLVLFCEVLRYSSGVDNVVCIMIFSAFLCISVIPEFIDVITGSNTGEPSSDRKWGLDLFIGGHNVLILPAVTTLRALAIFIQARATIGNQPSALSLLGLLVQAAVFTLVGLSWIVRVRYPPSVNNWSSWYHSVGWPVVGNLVYAIGQAILWCLARYGAGERLSSKLNAGGEVEPLLGKL